MSLRVAKRTFFAQIINYELKPLNCGVVIVAVVIITIPAPRWCSSNVKAKGKVVCVS
jgi:hypothetical protein